ncbi:MAG: hypothetical protein IJ838_00255 [Paludibacteraceae bacterium]|nr:hypothetical protein [Paludibacteraceae bacterium]
MASTWHGLVHGFTDGQKRLLRASLRFGCQMSVQGQQYAHKTQTTVRNDHTQNAV